MSALTTDTDAAPADEPVVAAPAVPEPPAGRRLPALPPPLALVVRWVLVGVGALAAFSVLLVAKDADPWDVLRSMWESAAGDSTSIGETLVRATPLLLAALATAVPARGGQFNIGAEGQLLLGAVGGMLVADQLGGAAPGPVTIVAMLLGGAATGAAWAAIPALLKRFAATNEAITSLLLNYVAALVVTWLVFGPWKDPTSLGQAYSRSLEGPERLPILWGTRVHLGIVVALAAAIVCWFLLRRTRWGFALSVLGGNPEAARRAGLAVGGLSVGAMLVGGALGGLGGVLHLAGVEARLRPDLLVGYGYVGFLASWLARHDPLKAVGAAILLGAIAVGGTGLKISAGLSGGAVDVLMALLLLAVLGWGRPKAVS